MFHSPKSRFVQFFSRFWQFFISMELSRPNLFHGARKGFDGKLWRVFRCERNSFDWIRLKVVFPRIDWKIKRFIFINGDTQCIKRQPKKTEAKVENARKRASMFTGAVTINSILSAILFVCHITPTNETQTNVVNLLCVDFFALLFNPMPHHSPFRRLSFSSFQFRRKQIERSAQANNFRTFWAFFNASFLSLSSKTNDETKWKKKRELEKKTFQNEIVIVKCAYAARSLKKSSHEQVKMKKFFVLAVVRTMNDDNYISSTWSIVGKRINFSPRSFH